MNIVYNMDCMIGMKDYPDNYFDLAIVDPPYGAGLASEGGCQGWFAKYREDNKELGTHFHYRGRSKRFKDMREQPKISRGGGSTGNTTVKVHRQGANSKRNGKWVFPEWNSDKKTITWDVAPEQDYFDELFRISHNQVIWGGKLLLSSAYPMLPDMAQNKCFRKVLDGDV